MKRNNIFIMAIFFVVSIFISLIFNNIESAYEVIKENNVLYSNKAINMEINCKDIKSDDFYKIVKDVKEVYLEASNVKCSTYYGKAIYCNYDMKNVPPMMDGEFMKFKDDNYEKKYCVIGKNLKDLVNTVDNKKYISIENKDYLVIGIMGAESRTTAFDDTFYINVNKENISSLINSKWLVDGRDTESSCSFIRDEILKIDENANVTNSNLDESKTSLAKVIEDRSFIIAILGLVILTLLLNIINSTNHYINQRKKEFGIRRTFGATKSSIYKKIIFDYEVMAAKSYILSQIVYIAIVKFNNVPYILGEKINFKASLYTFFVLLMIGTVVSIIPIKESNKYEPSEVMKGI